MQLKPNNESETKLTFVFTDDREEKKRETKQNQTTQIQVEWVGITKETTEKHSVNSHGVKGIKEKQKTKE